MTCKIKLVQGDTRPGLVVTITDQNSGSPVNITGTAPVMKFRAVGSTELVDTLTGAVLDGSAGLVKFDWSPLSLAGPPGEYEGEISVVFPDSTEQTVYDVLKFRMRQEF